LILKAASSLPPRAAARSRYLRNLERNPEPRKLSSHVRSPPFFTPNRPETPTTLPVAEGAGAPSPVPRIAGKTPADARCSPERECRLRAVAVSGARTAPTDSCSSASDSQPGLRARVAVAHSGR